MNYDHSVTIKLKPTEHVFLLVLFQATLGGRNTVIIQMKASE